MNTMGTLYHLILSLTIVAIQITPDQTDVRNKPAEEFEVKMDYSFKERPQEENKAAYEAVEKRSRKPAGPLPYLVITVKVIVLSDQETRLKAVDSNGKTIANRKATENTEIEIKWGFSEDIKDRIVPHFHTVLFLDDRKKPVSQIHMLVEEDGTFFVNGEKRGKF